MKDGKIVTACVGLGACGSAMVEAAVSVELGKGFVLNSSAEDLEAIQLLDRDSKFKFGSINGAAKSRKIGFDAFKNEHQKFLTALENCLFKDGEKVDVLFVFASAGGGTGSGIIPICCQILRAKYPQVSIVPVVVMPALNERGIAQQNALDCLRELDVDNHCVIVVDNSRVDSDMILQKYDAINRETVETLKRLVNFGKVSRISNIDVADRLSMFNDPGILVTASALADETDESPIRDAIKRAIDATPMCADVSKNVKRVALQCELQADMYTERNRSDAQEIFKNVAGIYEGYYAPDTISGGEGVEPKPVNRVLVAFSGAHLSRTSIRERENVVEQQFKADQTAATDVSRGNSDLKDSWAGNSKKESNANADGSFDDIFAQFE